MATKKPQTKAEQIAALLAPAAPAPAMAPLAVTIEQAGALLSISRSAAYRVVDEGELRTVTIGAKRRVPVSEIQRYLDAKLA